MVLEQSNRQLKIYPAARSTSAFGHSPPIAVNLCTQDAPFESRLVHTPSPDRFLAGQRASSREEEQGSLPGSQLVEKPYFFFKRLSNSALTSSGDNFSSSAASASRPLTRGRRDRMGGRTALPAALAFPISSASEAMVGSSNRHRTGISTSNTRRILEISWIPNKECPPSSKKF
jgi:hypothetical protein